MGGGGGQTFYYLWGCSNFSGGGVQILKLTLVYPWHLISCSCSVLISLKTSGWLKESIEKKCVQLVLLVGVYGSHQ